MTGFVSAIIIVLLLGILITVHEAGHYLAARLCKIRVREFAIGMGPAFFKRQKKDETGEATGTKFTLRVFPIGGYCDLGEDDDSDDPAHFRNKKIWQKAFVLLAGSLMNLALGLVFYLILFSTLNAIVVPEIHSLEPDFPYAEQIRPGDRFRSINGHRIGNIDDFYLFLSMDADKPYTFELERDGKLVTVTGATRQLNEGTRFGFTVGRVEELTVPLTVQSAVNATYSSVRLVWVSLGQIISGAAKVTDLAGPVAMGGIVNTIIEEDATAGDILRQLLHLAGLVAVNLAVFNLLPIPALDGGRILFLFISAFLVLVRKKPLSAKVEGYIHGTTMVLLFGLMIFVFFNDIRRLIGL